MKDNSSAESSVTYILRGESKDRFGRHWIMYWEGHDWSPQEWDACHFSSFEGAKLFIKDHCEKAIKGGWQFYIVPIDFSNGG